MIANEDMYDFFGYSIEDQTNECSSGYMMEPYEEEELERIRIFARDSDNAHRHTIEMYLNHVNVLINRLSIARSNESKLCPNNALLDSQIASLVQIGRKLKGAID